MNNALIDSQNPIEKLLNHGSTALTDVELLAIFLRTGTQGKSSVEQAQELLSVFGSWKALLGADQKKCSATITLSGRRQLS